VTGIREEEVTRLELVLETGAQVTVVLVCKQ